MPPLFSLQSKLTPQGHQPQSIQHIVKGIHQGLQHQVLLGVTGSGKTFTMAHVIAQLQRPALILAPNKTLAAQLYGEMHELFPHNAVGYFVSYYDYYQPEAYVAATDSYIAKDASINSHIEQMRLSSTKYLMEERQDVIIVATVSAIYGLGDPKTYLKMILHLSRGDLIDQRDILHRLIELQYRRTTLELQPGQYRVTGDMIDIFPAESSKEAVRIELFGDQIDRLSYFDPLTGHHVRDTARLTIYPKTHYTTPRQRLLEAIELIRSELKERLAAFRNNNQLVEAQRLQERTLFDIEMMQEMGYCTGIENYSRYLSQRQVGEPPPTLLDYLPDDALLIIDESHVTVPQLGGMYHGDRSRKETLVQHGFRLPSALDNRPLTFSEVEQLAPQTIYVSATPGRYEQQHAERIIELLVRPTGLLDPKIEIRPATHQVDDLLSEINQRVTRHERVLVTTLTKRMSEHLTDYLSEHGIRVRYLHSDIGTVERMEILRDLRLGHFDVLVGINLLREGLDLPEVSLVAILDADKEGFLRSKSALIQTIGRAARNLNGTALLYADRITEAIQYAMEETQRRRNIQAIFNQEHHITPRSIQKAVLDIMEAHGPSKKKRPSSQQSNSSNTQHHTPLTPEAFNAQLKDLQKRMQHHAKQLEFEKAIAWREKIEQLRHDFLIQKQ